MCLLLLKTNEVPIHTQLYLGPPVHRRTVKKIFLLPSIQNMDNFVANQAKPKSCGFIRKSV